MRREAEPCGDAGVSERFKSEPGPKTTTLGSRLAKPAKMAAGTGSDADELRRNSPASSVCYMEYIDPLETAISHQRSSNTMEEGTAAQEAKDLENPAFSLQPDDESDGTPRSEMPSVVDSSVVWDQHTSAQPTQTVPSEPGYFSPQPLRFYPTRLPTSMTASTEPSPTQSLNASATSIHVPQLPSLEHPDNPSTPLEQQDRPTVQRDASSASAASANTVRAASTDPIHQFTTPPKPQRDGPHYPNQSYAALQAQHYPPPYLPLILRTRSSHPSHYSSFSATQISTFGLAYDQDRSMADSGSRTVGNSPAGSPGLFSPTTPPLRPGQQSSEDPGFYSSPYLHYTHRQAPKEYVNMLHFLSWAYHSLSENLKQLQALAANLLKDSHRRCRRRSYLGPQNHQPVRSHR